MPFRGQMAKAHFLRLCVRQITILAKGPLANQAGDWEAIQPGRVVKNGGVPILIFKVRGVGKILVFSLLPGIQTLSEPGPFSKSSGPERQQKLAQTRGKG